MDLVRPPGEQVEPEEPLAVKQGLILVIVAMAHGLVKAIREIYLFKYFLTIRGILLT